MTSRTRAHKRRCGCSDSATSLLETTLAVQGYPAPAGAVSMMQHTSMQYNGRTIRWRGGEDNGIVNSTWEKKRGHGGSGRLWYTVWKQVPPATASARQSACCHSLHCRNNTVHRYLPTIICQTDTTTKVQGRQITYLSGMKVLSGLGQQSCYCWPAAAAATPNHGSPVSPPRPHRELASG